MVPAHCVQSLPDVEHGRYQVAERNPSISRSSHMQPPVRASTRDYMEAEEDKGKPVEHQSKRQKTHQMSDGDTWAHFENPNTSQSSHKQKTPSRDKSVS